MSIEIMPAQTTQLDNALNSGLPSSKVYNFLWSPFASTLYKHLLKSFSFAKIN